MRTLRPRPLGYGPATYCEYYFSMAVCLKAMASEPMALALRFVLDYTSLAVTVFMLSFGDDTGILIVDSCYSNAIGRPLEVLTPKAYTLGIYYVCMYRATAVG